MDRTAEAMIRLDGVSKRYDDGTVAVDDLDFDVTQGHLVALVGPSGCGKTTTLKMVNRLIEPSGGRIIIDGEDVTTVDPVALRRRIGYVIQNAGLFPHRSILDNVTTVPQLLDWDQARMRTRGMELLELVGLDPDTYASRYPHQLSGGQRQRVGVARALAADPPVLLMDEPFGAVDPVVRERLQSEFIRLQAEVRKTIMFVTHDIEEAVRLSDKVAVFAQGGKLMQYDSPGTILGAPSSEFVADFVGADRALKRLSVTTIDDISLERPPVVHLDDRLAFAGARLRSAGSRWGVVLDDREGLHGWVRLESTEREGRVSDAARRMDAWVPVGSSLKHAFSMMLQHDAGWVAVLDGERYLGVLTPATLHEALRRSVETEAGEADRDTVVVESVNSA